MCKTVRARVMPRSRAYESIRAAVGLCWCGLERCLGLELG